MDILRVIDKETKIFIRDDFIFNKDTEIGLKVEPSQGLYVPKWNGEAWEEGATQEYIDNLKAQVTANIPTEIERLEALENAMLELILGGI